MIEQDYGLLTRKENDLAVATFTNKADIDKSKSDQVKIVKAERVRPKAGL